MKPSIFVTACVLAVMVAGAAFAGSLDAPADPTSATSAMYTLESIYQRLATGAAGTKRVGPFAEPGTGPTAGTGHTLDEIMALAPAVDNTNGATAGDVMNTKRFWGLNTATGVWGLQSGTLACAATATGTAVSTDVLTGKTFSNSSANGITGAMTDNGTFGLSCGATNQTVNPGYYSGGTLTGDAGLIPANIKGGTTIFGVSGNSKIMDTTTGTAAAADILSGKTAFVNGAAVTGSIATQTVSNATVNQSAGYYAAFNLSTVDSNLAAANIVSGKTIFGVAGSAVARTCTGTLSAGGRWCDYGTVGTVMDMTTGLVWLKNANCSANLATVNNTGAGLAWSDAVVWSSAVKSGECGLSDSSVEGDWRLPTQSELKALTTGTENVLSGSPGPFSGVQVHGYWSATTWSLATTYACLVYLDDGVEGAHDKSNTNYVWPVR